MSSPGTATFPSLTSSKDPGGVLLTRFLCFLLLSFLFKSQLRCFFCVSTLLIFSLTHAISSVKNHNLATCAVRNVTNLLRIVEDGYSSLEVGCSSWRGRMRKLLAAKG